MSRIGKAPITVPSGVEVKMSGTLDLTSEQLDNRLNMLLAKAAR